jgi:transglutaminase-like putative cysteine protease
MLKNSCVFFIVLAVLLVPAPKAAFAAADVRSETKSEIDVTNSNNGYISARSTSKTPKRLKIRTSYAKPAGANVEYDYDLNGDSDWETYSLQSGNGKYTVSIFENVDGSRYSQIQTINVDVKYSRKNAPFLVPAQTVNYTDQSNAIKKAEELCKDAATDLKKVENIYKYIVETIKYDTAKANKVAAGELNGYLPKVDDTLETSKGICFDYSALFAAMLRSRNIPAKLIKGYVTVSSKPVYHAWNEVYIAGTGWIRIRSEVHFNGKDWGRMDSTFASGNTSGGKTKFMSEDKNYARDKEY